MAHLDFGVCIYAHYIILMKEVRKVVEIGIYKIVIMKHMDFGACS